MLTNGRLALAATDEPAMGAGDVLVRVRAVSVNRGELHRLEARQAGWRPGWDFAGEVLECGSATGGHTVGDRVFGTVPGGAWAERVAAPAGYLAQLPDTLTFAQGAAKQGHHDEAGRERRPYSLMAIGVSGRADPCAFRSAGLAP
jgi:NADPH:quinone reductase-like Zn-dependent oxidoreductase